MISRFLPQGRLAELRVRGAGLDRDVAEAVTSASLDLSSDQVSQLNLTLSDADDAILRAQLFSPGGPDRAGSAIDYLDLDFECATLASTPADGGTLTVAARSRGAQALKRRRGPLVRSNLSPTTFAGAEAAAVGLRFVGQPSASMASITRQSGDDVEEESSWDTLQRLAGEIGYVCFESAGTLYFAQPTWLTKRAENRLSVSWLGRESKTGLLQRPECSRSGDAAKAAEITVTLDHDLGDGARPGGALVLFGVPSFDGVYLIDSVKIPFDDGDPVVVTASTAVDPEPQPPATATETAAAERSGVAVLSNASASSKATSTSTAQALPAGGARTAASFVAVAQSQAGKAYIFGAEASSSNASPSAFDCSELVEWACARVGVTITDGSAAQKAACTPISVAVAARTRGALLFRPGHVAISLGTGNGTIEAKGRAYGVLNDVIGNRFDSAGLIRGLSYPITTANRGDA